MNQSPRVRQSIVCAVLLLTLIASVTLFSMTAPRTANADRDMQATPNYFDTTPVAPDLDNYTDFNQYTRDLIGFGFLTLLNDDYLVAFNDLLQWKRVLDLAIIQRGIYNPAEVRRTEERPPLTDLPLTVPPDPALAGVDFAGLELTYVSEFDLQPFEGMAFTYRAVTAEPGAPTIDFAAANQLASDAFFTWLALPNQAFWVNLNPGEPDRIIDPRLAITDAGRVLLEADLELKTSVAILIHPETGIHADYWNRLYDFAEERGAQQMCFSFRQWIVPGAVRVWATDDTIMILDAPLDVQLETDYFEIPDDDGTFAAQCPGGDPETQAFAEQLFRETVLPDLVQMVNTAPEYQELRTVFYARVIAEWYKNRNLADGRALYADLVNQGDASAWSAVTPWNPRDVFDAYVQSVTDGIIDLTITNEWQEGNTTYTTTRTYFHGGVDFTRVPMEEEDDETAEEEEADAGALAMVAALGPSNAQDGGSILAGGVAVR